MKYISYPQFNFGQHVKLLQTVAEKSEYSQHVRVVLSLTNSTDPMFKEHFQINYVLQGKRLESKVTCPESTADRVAVDSLTASKVSVFKISLVQLSLYTLT